MDGVMFGTCEKFVIFVRTVALKALDHAQAHASVHVGVFTVGLLTASPARVTEHVDIRSPER